MKALEKFQGNCMLHFVLFAVVLSCMMGFSGCSNTPPTAPAAGTTITAPALMDQATAQRWVYTAKETYGIAVRAATVYAELPRCGTQPCSDQAKVDQIVKIRNTAREALAAAAAAADNPVFGKDAMSTAVAVAQSAMLNFSNITATLK